MAEAAKQIEVRVPLSTAYNQWTQFERFSQFMDGVTSVRQLDDRRLEWHAEIGEKEEAWEAEITEQLPDQRIAWRSVSGSHRASVVTFDRLSDNETRMLLQLAYEPEEAGEGVGEVLSIVERRVQGDLECFKEFIEARGAETGAWRGEIRPAQ